MLHKKKEKKKKNPLFEGMGPAPVGGFACP